MAILEERGRGGLIAFTLNTREICIDGKAWDLGIRTGKATLTRHNLCSEEAGGTSLSWLINVVSRQVRDNKTGRMKQQAMGTGKMLFRGQYRE